MNTADDKEMDETAILLADPINRAMLLKSIEQHKNGESITVIIPDDPEEPTLSET